MTHLINHYHITHATNNAYRLLFFFKLLGIESVLLESYYTAIGIGEKSNKFMAYALVNPVRTSNESFILQKGLFSP